MIGYMTTPTTIPLPVLDAVARELAEMRHGAGGSAVVTLWQRDAAERLIRTYLIEMAAHEAAESARRRARSDIAAAFREAEEARDMVGVCSRANAVIEVDGVTYLIKMEEPHGTGRRDSYVEINGRRHFIHPGSRTVDIARMIRKVLSEEAPADA